MREYTSPAMVTIADEATLTDVLSQHAATKPTAVLFRRRPSTAEPAATESSTPTHDWTPVTAAEFLAQVERLAAGFLASGLTPGQRVGLLSRTRYEWTLVDYALWHAGLVTVPIYETSAPDQIRWILSDSQAAAVVVESAAHAETVEALRDELPELRNVWVIDTDDLDGLAAVATAPTRPHSAPHARR